MRVGHGSQCVEKGHRRCLEAAGNLPVFTLLAIWAVLSLPAFMGPPRAYSVPNLISLKSNRDGPEDDAAEDSDLSMFVTAPQLPR